MANITFSEGSGINGSIFGSTQTAVRMIIEKRGEQFEQESVVERIFKHDHSTHWAEKYTGLTAMEGFKVAGENGPYPTDGQEESYSKVLEAVTWKDSFSLSREIVEDSKTIDLRKKPAGFVTAYYRTREKLGAALLGGAISGSSGVSYAGGHFDLKTSDGQTLFYAAHPAKLRGDTQCNLFSDAFSADALGMLEVKMQNTRGDNDEILDVAPDTILIPNIHSLKKAVFAAIGADKDPETANNGFNGEEKTVSLLLSEDGYVDADKMRRPTAYDFRSIADGVIRETVDGNITVSYAVEKDALGRIVLLTTADGHETAVRW